jgi:signal transduction histidine kinase/CheY-like chemotaxis protein
MSSTTFPHFIFLIGLNFINVLCQGAEYQPSQRFAQRIEGTPAWEFHDVLQVGDSVWCAGDGLYTLKAGDWTPVLEDERVSALASSDDTKILAYATLSSIELVDASGKSLGQVSNELGFIWSMEWLEGKFWIFGSEGYGWVDPLQISPGKFWKESFSPRPLVSKVQGETARLFVGSNSGLWEITGSGKVLVASPEKLSGEIVPWIAYANGNFYLGTINAIYRWSGKAGEDPLIIESNYSDYFESGLSNAVSSGDYIAITEYPSGVALFSTDAMRVVGFVSNDSANNIGDVFKIKEGAAGEIILLGDRGIAKSSLLTRSRFFPAAKISQLDADSAGIADAGAAHVFSKKEWIRIDEDTWRKGTLSRAPDWMDLDAQGNLVHGANVSYEQFSDQEWVEMRSLPFSLLKVTWGAQRAYALGVKGIYSLSPGLDADLIYPESDQLSLIGEFDSKLYLHSGDGKLCQLWQGDGEWTLEKLKHSTSGEVVATDSNERGVWWATSNSVYQFFNDKLASVPAAPGWRVKAMKLWASDVAILYAHPEGREWAVGLFTGNGKVMLSIPHKDYMGDPVDVMLNDTHLGIVGTNGIGWFPFDELSRLAAPRVDFALLFEDKRIEDRTIPPGMHFIDLQVSFSGPEVPSLVQYRINEDRWRTVNLNDPSLQFAGHGSFNVELRAIHPNGNVSPSKLVQFGIAPPWYLNPVYQGIMLFLAIGVIWFLYYLRSAQLKRTNAWLQREVKKQTRELESATAARTNFLAGLSHDIRNPLNGVLMIAETLSRNPPKSGEDPRLKDLTEFGIIVDRMLGEILDFSAIDQDRIPTSLIPVSVMDIIDSSVKQNQFSIQHEMVALETVVAEELKSVVIRTDRNWMIKVLSNLIVNALEYSESNRVEVSARCLRLTETEVDMELHVADWGIGIDESEKPFVFERFYRGESGIESGKHGTGLGLSICQEIAHAMGGHIRIEDNEPSGCRFVLTGRFDRMEETSELDKEAVLAKLSGQRILIVDDLVYNRKSIVEFFETIGCQCDQAENGRDALGLLDENSYYLALLDWDLPGLTGPEIARRHRKKHSSDPVILIAVTAYTDGEKKRESEEAGMNGYISKPLTATRLAYCLANIENWKPEAADSIDKVDTDEVLEEIYKHIEDCLRHGEHYEWEDLRRCAHRLTTLALIKNNRAMQQVCRDLQISASEGNIKEAQVGLLELHKWRKP